MMILDERKPAFNAKYAPFSSSIDREESGNIIFLNGAFKITHDQSKTKRAQCFG